jgi:hypothetical protein
LSQSNGTITWVPLSPDEVRYPTTLSSGFTVNRWDTYFSVPAIAAYCPAPIPSYATHYSPNLLFIAQPCYSYWGRPVIKTVNIYKGPVTIVNKRRGNPYPDRVKNIYKGPVVIVNPPPKNSGKSTRNAAKNPVVPVNVQSGGASSAPAADFGKKNSHRRAASLDIAQMSRKKLSLLALREDRSITPGASARAPGLLDAIGSKPKASKLPEIPEQRTDGQERQTGKDKQQRPVPATRETPNDTAIQPRAQQERTDAKRPDRSSAERERQDRESAARDQQKQDNQAQERATRQDNKDERRETQQREENQQRQQRQEQERREREEREQRVQQERQQREERENRAREAKQAREQQERQEKEHRQQQEEQERERRRAEQQNNSQAAPSGGDADHAGKSGKRKDR